MIRPVSASVAWISIAPVKGMRMQNLDQADLNRDGVPGDRAFLIVDELGAMISATRLGALLAVVPDHDPEAGTLALRFPGGEEVAAAVEVGDPEPISFFGEPLRARPVLGPFSDAISQHCRRKLRLIASPENRPGVDRGAIGGATLLGVSSLERLRVEAGETESIDPRRFRMTFGIDGLEAHEEDGWIGDDIRIGDAVVRVQAHVGRCAATTRDPDSGTVDFRTLHHLKAYRGEVISEEPLPFGVSARIEQPGRVRVGDTVIAAAS